MSPESRLLVCVGVGVFCGRADVNSIDERDYAPRAHKPGPRVHSAGAALPPLCSRAVSSIPPISRSSRAHETHTLTSRSSPCFTFESNHILRCVSAMSYLVSSVKELQTQPTLAYPIHQSLCVHDGLLRPAAVERKRRFIEKVQRSIEDLQ